MEENRVSVEMTAQEKAAFEKFQEAEARRQAEEKARRMREMYTGMVDDEIDAVIPRLVKVSDAIAAEKRRVYDDFKAIIDLKAELFRLRKNEDMDVKSHTFTNSRGDRRIILGVNMIDNYLDTAEEGIAIVKEYITSLAKDEDSRALVDMTLKLLAKDAKGTLKASRIIQLRRLADQSGNARFIEGVRIIEESYSPAVSKTYVKAEIKGENGEWVSIPLGMTEA